MNRWQPLWAVLLFTSGLAADEDSASSLVAHYRFAEGHGDVLLDHSGHQHHGRIIGARWEQLGQRWALRFDGSGDYVDFGDNRALKMTGDFTLLAWVTLEAPAYPDYNTNWTVFDCENYPSEGTILRIDGAATTVMFRSSRSGSPTHQFGKARLANRGTYQVGMVRQGGVARIIVDGVADAEFACGAEPVYGNVPFKISSESQSFAGLIHEARIYRRALNAGEIAELYWREAGNVSKDVTGRGQLRLHAGIYADDPQVLAEVELLGVLPLAAGEQLVVSLVRGDGTTVLEQIVEPIPPTCQAATVFEMADQPPGDYSLSAQVRGAGPQARAATRQAFAWPVRFTSQAPSPRTFLAPRLPTPRQRLQPQVTILPGGGFHVTAGGRAVLVESRFSVPHDAAISLAADAAQAGKVASEGRQVTLANSHYRLLRDVQAQRGRVLVRDSLTNLTDQPVGILFQHRLALDSSQIKQFYLGGRSVSPPMIRSLKTNPTAFASLDEFGIGLVALDDVLIVQSQGGCDGEGLTLGSPEFALAPRATYTVEWAVYVTASGDYYDLVNDLRADEGRNQTTVQGTWVTPTRLMSKRVLEYVPPPSYFDVRRPAYFCIPCLSWSTDDPTVSLEGIEFLAYPQERAAVRGVIDAVSASRPQLKTMFHVAPNLYATDKPDQLWPDSRLIGPDGKQTVYAYNYEASSYFTPERLAGNWRWWSYYPAVDNSYGQALLDSVDVMLGEMGVSGVFVDGALWDYGGAYSYDRFDGHTADLDPATGTITRLKTAVPLVQQHAVAAWGRKVMDRGGVVVANNALPTRTFAGQPFIFDKEVSEGPEIHLLPTPCTLGNPGAIGSEADVYDDVLAKLAWGNLYFYYGEPLDLRHELPPARMYPITVTEVRSGCVSGRERIVTARDGVYGWPGEGSLHLIYRYDRRGRRIGHDFVTTVDAEGARTEVHLNERELAIIEKLPLVVQTASAVNVTVNRRDEQTLELSIHGYGPATLAMPGGRVQELQLNGEQHLTIP